ncbi:MAG: DUF167 domain-containing protein [Nitrospiraceae bacterium]
MSLSIRAQPRAARSECVGLYGDGTAIKIRLAAPPIDGAANDELIRFLAERLGVVKRQVEVRVGETARGKQVVVTGVTLAQVKERLGL